MKDNEKTKYVSIRWTLVAVSVIPLVVISTFLTLISISTLKSGMISKTLSGLKSTVVAVDAGINALNNDTYYLDENNELWKEIGRAHV